MEIYWSKIHNRKSLIPLWELRRKYYGIKPDDRRCYFFTTKIINNQEQTEERTERGLGFSKFDMSENRIQEIYRKIIEFKPKWMILQPSMGAVLMDIGTRYDMPPISSLQYIELTGERIPPKLQEKMRDFFRCPVVSQYGCYEVNSIAYECPCGHMHIVTENVYVETLNERGESVTDKKGEIYLTSLHNRVMPFVRYGIGDIGILHKNHSCPCGNGAPIIELASARDNDFIYNEDGSRLHADIFANGIEKVNLIQEGSIVQYQIVQTDYSDFEIYLVVDEEENKKEIAGLLKEMLGIFTQNRNFHFYFCHHLVPSEKTGKMAWFTSKVKEGEKIW
ncbi:MAG: AMP-binding protein [Lachnospiraceae bacterium]|nr:AMP-binding protein [Lachnospiraceae bacterium]